MPPIHLVYLFCFALAIYFHIDLIVIMAIGMELMSLYVLLVRTFRKETFLTPMDVLLNSIHRIGLIGLAFYVGYSILVPFVLGATIFSLIYYTIVMVKTHPFESESK